MKLAILSRNRGLHSIQRLLQEAGKVGVSCDVINPLDCQLVVQKKRTEIVVGSAKLPRYDVLLPRIGASITHYGLAVVKQFEILGVRPINCSQSIAESRDKFRCIQILAEAGLKVPPTILNRGPHSLRQALEATQGFPVVLKLLQGTQGVGVMLIHTPIALRSVLDTLRSLNQDVLIQRFISEAAGRDYRAFVIGDRVVAAMTRQAPEGEFRSNIHRGGEGQLIRLPKTHEKAAVRAAQALGLEIAGVDLMDSSEGPMILELNSSPGFEGIEQATGLNIARLILQYIKKRGRRGR